MVAVRSAAASREDGIADAPAVASCGPSAPMCPPSSPISTLAVRIRRSFPLLLLLSALLPLSVRAQDGWQTGRATFYGYDGGATIHQGSCMYGGLPNNMVSTGVHIAALADTNYDYGSSCGRCYEVQCNPAAFTDGYGNPLDRTTVCHEGSPSVIVTITDSCPCSYPANEYSNRRWCCGDMYHIDLSQDAFSKLADINQGVAGVRYRQVQCPGGFVASPREPTWDFPAGTGTQQ